MRVPAYFGGSEVIFARRKIEERLRHEDILVVFVCFSFGCSVFGHDSKGVLSSAFLDLLRLSPTTTSTVEVSKHPGIFSSVEDDSFSVELAFS